jgi:putative membrane protein
MELPVTGLESSGASEDKAFRPGVFVKGMAMGAADVVPGVSGGTIALVSGIYEELVETLAGISPKLLLVWKQEGFVSFWQAGNFTFLLTLLTGVFASIALLASGLHWAMQHYPVPLWSFFFGLILASIWLVSQRVPAWNFSRFLLFMVGMGTALVIVMQPPLGTPEDSGALVFLLAGMLAICAMILPGISGSFILLLLGMYSPVLQAVHEREWVLLLSFVTGCAIGLLSFVHLLRWLLECWHDAIIVLLAGFMAGSLYRLWPWHIQDDKTGQYSNLGWSVYEAQVGELQIAFALAGLLIGLAVIILFFWWENKLKQPS